MRWGSRLHDCQQARTELQAHFFFAIHSIYRIYIAIIRAFCNSHSFLLSYCECPCSRNREPHKQICTWSMNRLKCNIAINTPTSPFHCIYIHKEKFLFSHWPMPFALYLTTWINSNSIRGHPISEQVHLLWIKKLFQPMCRCEMTDMLRGFFFLICPCWHWFGNLWFSIAVIRLK